MASVTNLGDASVTIMAAILLFVCYLLSSRTVALKWLIAVAACGLVTSAAKIALYLHGAAIPPTWLGSPSGHVAASVLVYGVLPTAACRPRPWVPLAALIVGLIAVSRVYLQAHSGSDVLAGAMIGGACLTWFLLGRLPAAPGDPLRAGAPLAIMLSVAVAAAGWRLPIDRTLQAFAAYLAS